jgi:hypothetical protein
MQWRTAWLRRQRSRRLVAGSKTALASLASRNTRSATNRRRPGARLRRSRKRSRRSATCVSALKRSWAERKGANTASNYLKNEAAKRDRSTASPGVDPDEGNARCRQLKSRGLGCNRGLMLSLMSANRVKSGTSKLSPRDRFSAFLSSITPSLASDRTVASPAGASSAASPSVAPDSETRSRASSDPRTDPRTASRPAAT